MLQNPVHTYARPGVYAVTLTAAGPGGFHSLQKRDFVVVSRMLTRPQAPPASGGAGPTPPRRETGLLSVLVAAYAQGARNRVLMRR